MEDSRRMSKDERRKQLLETAFQLVKTEGTDALTLARVAEQAGVTKPIAYEHFGTRSGLLIAMYQDYDRRQTEAMRAALEKEGDSLEDVVSILSAAYVDCAVSSGPEYGAITAALQGSGEMERLLQACRDSFAGECSQALAPYVKQDIARQQSVLIAILGAAEFLSNAAAQKKVSRDEAVNTLSILMTGMLAQEQTVSKKSAKPKRVKLKGKS